MFVAAAELLHLPDLAFGDITRINAAYSLTLLVHLQHEAGSFLFRFLEKSAQHIHDEIHGREIVVEQHHPEHGWCFGPWLFNDGQRCFLVPDAHAVSLTQVDAKPQTCALDEEIIMAELKCLLWDVDGTLADTERDGHRVAFNMAFAEAGIEREWDVPTYGELLAVTGGKERIRFDYERRNLEPPPAEEIARLHALKTNKYQELIASGEIPLRSGVRRLLTEAWEAGITLGVATTTTPAALDALIEHSLGSEWFDHFAVLAAGDIVPAKKPAPDIYHHAMAELGVDSKQCLALEDSGNGWKAASAAGLSCVVTINDYTHMHDFTGADLVVSEFGEPDSPEIMVVENPHGLTSLHHVTLDHLKAIMYD